MDPAPAPEPATLSDLTVNRWQRLLLPGALVTGRDERRSARDWAVDLLMFAIAVSVGALVLADTWTEHAEWAKVLDVVVGVVSCLAIWKRRSHAFGLAVALCVASTVSGLAAGAMLIAIFNAAIRASLRQMIPVTALAVLSSVLWPLFYPGHDGYLIEAFIGVLLVSLAIAWGFFARARRDLVRSLHERARHLEQENRLRAEQAREAERRRIATEMHDVLAHRISMLSLHAGALEFRPDAPAEEVAAAAGVIRASAHAALEELRDVIGVLREEDGECDETQPPQPTLEEIPALIERSREAGMKVEYEIDPRVRLPDETLARTAYRVVQEGLTNASKHAPNTAVEISIRERAGEAVEVRVANRPAVGAWLGGAAPPPGNGSGLIGLSERVGLVGGRLEHGRDGGGDFVLTATLPAREAR